MLSTLCTFIFICLDIFVDIYFHLMLVSIIVSTSPRLYIYSNFKFLYRKSVELYYLLQVTTNIFIHDCSRGDGFVQLMYSLLRQFYLRIISVVLVFDIPCYISACKNEFMISYHLQILINSKYMSLFCKSLMRFSYQTQANCVSVLCCGNNMICVVMP